MSWSPLVNFFSSRDSILCSQGSRVEPSSCLRCQGRCAYHVVALTFFVAWTCGVCPVCLDASSSTRAAVGKCRGVGNITSLYPCVYQPFNCSTADLYKAGKGWKTMKVTSPEKTYLCTCGKLSQPPPSTSSQSCFLVSATLSGRSSSSPRMNFHWYPQYPLSLPLPTAF